MSRAVVLLSGGLDSTTCLSEAIKQGYEVFPISFDYGQRHMKELDCVNQIIKYYKIKSHKLIHIDNVGGSALTDSNIDVPEYKGLPIIPVTYVPARTSLSYADIVIDADAIC